MEHILKQIDILQDEIAKKKVAIESKTSFKIHAIYLERKDIHVEWAGTNSGAVTWRIRGSVDFPMEASTKMGEWNIFSIHSFEDYTKRTGKTITL